MRSKSNLNKKRPRGGVGCLVAEKEVHAINDADTLRTEIVPLSRAFDLISTIPSNDDKQGSESNDATRNTFIEYQSQRRVRIVYPYPYTFATFAKARWVGRTIVDIYNDEFGSYPRCYYEDAVQAGRILVSGKKVQCDYRVKGGDELIHLVHRHEPAVAVADLSSKDPIQIVHENDKLLVVDKPATLPIHPCGGYNFNSLCEILSQWKPDVYGSGKLFTVHRLDRLTSGLVLLAKSSALAGTLGKCIMQRDGCEKIYLARVKGKFPLGLQHIISEMHDGTNDNVHPWKFQYCPQCGDEKKAGDGEMHLNKRLKCDIPPPCEYGEVCNLKTTIWKGGMCIPFKSNEGKKQNVAEDCSEAESFAGLGYWMTDAHGAVAQDALLLDLITQCDGLSAEEILVRAIGSTTSATMNNDTSSATESWLWLNFACPCRVASHKNGICEAGNLASSKADNYLHGIKPAQTLMSLLSYDSSSDTSLVLAKPVTGRTHQIRLHLQKLGHPIANDHCYGGELWFGDDEGKKKCGKSREWLDLLDRGEDGNVNAKLPPDNSTNSDTPATDSEVYHATADKPREDGESILDYIKRTCVWCARCRGVDGLRDSTTRDSAVFQRTLMEYLVRSQGIWLHALQYSWITNEDNGKTTSLTYRTDLPNWAKQQCVEKIE